MRQSNEFNFYLDFLKRLLRTKSVFTALNQTKDFIATHVAEYLLKEDLEKAKEIATIYQKFDNLMKEFTKLPPFSNEQWEYEWICIKIKELEEEVSSS